MRAALYDRYGPPEVLYVGRVPTPAPGPGEVLVKVGAASVNGGELTGRAGRLRVVTERAGGGWPRRVGIDFAGEVADLGGGAGGGWRVGDRVWGVLPASLLARGCAAEYVAVPADRIAPAPAGLDVVEAAALPAVGTTVITALRDKAGLAAGERLLVRGAAGGVGSAAVQLGRAYGAHVTALAGAHNLDFVRELGADEALDRRAVAPGDLGRFDVVLDTVGTGLAAWRRLLIRRGRMVTVSVDPDHLLASLGYIAASTVFGRRRVRFFRGDPGGELLAELTRLVQDGALRPVVDTVYPLADIAKAHAALEAGGVRGKLVVLMA
ncbi:NAD(P)-dependent alcohol dehydrogenase [Streptomonospora sp. S1-112]|uniref:NAD(P)-dependent alcohol dehydrogenase n=1 Tax=Streptomonospora mangrovi TaxID=2883123 RepID=A0A9X3NJT5_9ACTN|nr:NAD(P)-dependent alcohol dehydrogenase [Streptomonospora mangrovi]MDA0563371.1 NAD(P)-dependent alcohol dehydrogenase [Streptomonospora mangrovi]